MADDDIDKPSDWYGDLFAGLAAVDTTFDPVRATERARANVRRVLPKRFYSEVRAESAGDAFRLTLDGKPVLTPAHKAVEVPDMRIACAIEAEWANQEEFIDPATMPLTRLVNAAIDGVAGEMGAVKTEIARFAMSDLLFYRAEGPDRLVARQKTHWDPIVAWAEKRFGVPLRHTVGVVHVDQDPALPAAVEAALPDRPLALAAMHTVTSVTGSALIALAVAERFLDPDAGWTAAYIDEDWNAELWGMDDEAVERRAFRRSEYDAALVALGLR
jgi:chaperone required for assembly of F1-ATPase